MCFGGGGNAAAAAEQQERERQAQIAAANQRIQGIFGSPERQSQIEDLRQATREYFQSDLDRQHDISGRRTKFALARSGLSGGSADIDLNRQLAEDYLRGLLEVDRRANSAASGLRAQDTATKTSLFQQILGGLDATTAATEASRALQQNVSLAKSDAYQQGLGDLFGGFGDIWKSSLEGAAQRKQAYDFNTLYGPRTSTAGGY